MDYTVLLLAGEKDIEKLVKSLENLSMKIEMNNALLRELLLLLKKSVYEVEEYVRDPLFEGIDDEDAKVVLKAIIDYATANKTNIIPLRAIVNETGLSRRRVVNAIRYLNDKGYDLPITKADEIDVSPKKTGEKKEKK